MYGMGCLKSWYASYGLIVKQKALEVRGILVAKLLTPSWQLIFCEVKFSLTKCVCAVCSSCKCTGVLFQHCTVAALHASVVVGVRLERFLRG
jgi:hypothetical protein